MAPSAATISVRRRQARRVTSTTREVLAPMLVRRASDPNAALTPAEAAVRDMRLELLGQLGGDPSPAQRHLVDGICVALIVQMTLERYLLRLIGDDGLVNKQRN